MDKKIKKLGIIDADGYELDNRVYARGGVSPTIKAGNARINTVRKAFYRNRSNGQHDRPYF